MTMGKRLGSLWILLAVQILAAIWLWWPRPSGAVTGQPWLSFTPHAVTHIALTDGSKAKPQTLTLQRRDGKWRLPDAGNFPADAGKVKHLLHAVAGLRGTLPVALTHDAARRFHVAKNRFQTRVTLAVGKRQLARFYVGNSAGANRVYLRRAGSHVVEANALPSWLVAPSASAWRDHGLLHLTPGKLTRVTLPALTLVKHKGSWQAQGSTTTLDKSKVQSLLQHLTELGFSGVAGKKAAHPLQASFTLSADHDGKTLDYVFAKAPGKSAKPTAKGKAAQAAPATWRMTRSDLPYVFTVSDSDVNALRHATAKSLAATAKKPKPAQASSTATPPHSRAAGVNAK